MRILYKTDKGYRLALAPRLIPRLLQLGLVSALVFDRHIFKTRGESLVISKAPRLNSYCVEVLPGIYAAYGCDSLDSSFIARFTGQRRAPLVAWLNERKAAAIRLHESQQRSQHEQGRV